MIAPIVPHGATFARGLGLHSQRAIRWHET